MRGSDPAATIQIAFLSNRKSSDASKWGLHYGAVAREKQLANLKNVDPPNLCDLGQHS